MSFNFQITSKATFDNSAADALRARLFGKPRHLGGLKATVLMDATPAVADMPRPAKLTRRPLKKASLKKISLQADDQKPAVELVRRRIPVEYLGFSISTEQQGDGKWVASIVRSGSAPDSARRSAPHPASYMAFADAKQQIDDILSGTSTGQREFQRIPVALDGMIFAAGTMLECQLIDLSAGGARMRRANPVALTGDVVLYIQGFGRYRAHVSRSGDTELSVRFAIDEDTVLSLLKGLSSYVKGFDCGHTKLRKETRVTATLAAVCRTGDGASLPCQILNASLRSMSLAMAERPQIGSLVTLGKTKLRVMRHHDQGIAVQCLGAPTVRTDRFRFSEAV
jgi:hypothetical protein